MQGCFLAAVFGREGSFGADGRAVAADGATDRQPPDLRE